MSSSVPWKGQCCLACRHQSFWRKGRKSGEKNLDGSEFERIKCSQWLVQNYSSQGKGILVVRGKETSETPCGQWSCSHKGRRFFALKDKGLPIPDDMWQEKSHRKVLWRRKKAPRPKVTRTCHKMKKKKLWMILVWHSEEYKRGKWDSGEKMKKRAAGGPSREPTNKLQRRRRRHCVWCLFNIAGLGLKRKSY